MLIHTHKKGLVIIQNRMCLTCSAHSGRGLSTQMISFLQGKEEKDGTEKREVAQQILGSSEHDDTGQRHGLSTQLISLHRIKLSRWQLAMFSCLEKKVIFIKSNGNMPVFWFGLGFFFGQCHPGGFYGCSPVCALICSCDSPAWSRGQPITFLSLLCQASYSSQSLASVTSHQLDQ